MSESLTNEIHGIPGIVAAPILPVLYDTVERHIILTMPVDNLQQLVLRLVSLPALPETVCPQREHVNLSRELAHKRVYTVGRPSIHEIIVGRITNLGRERHSAGIVLEVSPGIIVPIDAPPLQRLNNILEVLKIRLFHKLLRATSV